MFKKRISLDNIEIYYFIKKTSRKSDIKIIFISKNEIKILISNFNIFFNPEKFILKNKKIILDKIQKLKLDKVVKIILSTKEFKNQKKKFLLLAQKKVNYFNSFYNFKYNKIYIKNQKTKWGSCSSKRNLNFNYRVFVLPQYLADYIIVHEICHLKEMNHSKDFWLLVQKTIPDYKNIKKELEKYIF